MEQHIVYQKMMEIDAPPPQFRYYAMIDGIRVDALPELGELLRGGFWLAMDMPWKWEKEDDTIISHSYRHNRDLVYYQLEYDDGAVIARLYYNFNLYPADDPVAVP